MRSCTASFLGLFLVVLFARDAHACSCKDDIPLCETFWKTPVVFAGEVADITEVRSLREPRMVAERLVRFRVHQSWRGQVSGEVLVQTGAGGGDCGYSFERGGRYLVYASHFNGRLSTSICSPTKALAVAAGDLAYLKKAFQPSVAGRVFGRVVFQRTSDDAPLRALAGYSVTLAGRQKERSTTTDDEGRYEFRDVPAGTFRVRVQVPPTEHVFGPREVEIVDPRGCAAANFYVVFDGRISARVLHTDGRPAAGYTFEAVTLDSLQGDRYPASRPVTTSAEGQAEVPHLAPDRYVVGLGITRGAQDRQPHGKLYYPGVTDLASANVIDLAPGQRIDLGDFVLPAPLHEQPLTGLVVWADGTPAARAEVVLLTIRDGWTVYNHSVKADTEGRFAFRGYVGERYRLTAFSQSAGGAQWTARTADFELTSQTANQKLSLQAQRPPR